MNSPIVSRSLNSAFEVQTAQQFGFFDFITNHSDISASDQTTS
jgi:hypothetical protein